MIVSPLVPFSPNSVYEIQYPSLQSIVTVFLLEPQEPDAACRSLYNTDATIVSDHTLIGINTYYS
jgi:hypothetical protein